MKTTIEFAREAAGDEWYLFREFMPEIHKLAELIHADEREACAKVCEEVGEESDSFTRDILRSTAAAIRARMAEQPAQQEPEEDLYYLAVRADNEGQP